MRIRLDLAYDGTDFAGWAAQPGLRTVEGELSAALTTLLRAPDPVRLVVAGRTDAGVHARGQVAHADIDPVAYAALPGRFSRPPEVAAVTRLRGILPADVVVHRVRAAPPGFDARFAAIHRRYRYRICDDPSQLDPLRRRETVVLADALDGAAMHASAQELLGLNDFAAFCKRREGATTIRTLLDYSWTRAPDGTLEATVVADAFCHSMVRALVGSVIPVGLGRAEASFPAHVLRAGIRDPRVKVMPAHGLCLEEVGYPPDEELAARASAARSRRELPDASTPSHPVVMSAPDSGQGPERARRADRDRDLAGRARQARPRDELGRPLPYGSVGVEPVPEEALAPRETLSAARELLRAGRPFAAHELLEARWKAAPDSERDLWQGLAQLCVGLTHAARGNAVGAARLTERGLGRLRAHLQGGGAAYGLNLSEVIERAGAGGDAADLLGR